MKAILDQTYKNIEIIVVDEGLERSAQRNIGIKRAKGDYLLILDSDQFPTQGLVEECVNLMGKYTALYIPERIMINGWFGKIRDWERQFYTATPIDCVRFVDRYRCGLFDEKQTGPEDADWDRRIGGRKGVTKNFFYHYENVDFWSYFKKKAYYAKSMQRFIDRNPGDKVLNPFWRCFWVFMENGKWKRFIAKPHYAVVVLGMIFVRGVIYLWQK